MGAELLFRIDSDSAEQDRFVNGTQLTADWLNTLMEELANFVESAGLTLDKNNNRQLLQAAQNRQDDALGPDSISGSKLEDSAVTTAKLAALAVSGSKIESDAVTTEKIADGAVTNNKLEFAAITNEKIQDAAITGVKIANQSLEKTKLSNALQSSIDGHTNPFSVVIGTVAQDSLILPSNFRSSEVLTIGLVNTSGVRRGLAQLTIPVSSLKNQSTVNQRFVVQTYSSLNNRVENLYLHWRGNNTRQIELFSGADWAFIITELANY